MTKETKFVYGMVAFSLLLVVAFIVLWKVSSNRLVAGKSGTIVERQIDRDFDVVDAGGEARRFKQLEGKVTLVSHVFTRCPGQCAGIAAILGGVRDEFGGDGPLHFVSVSLDPEHDTPEQLKEFSTKHGLAADNWWFVTGEPEGLNRYMAEVFWLRAEKLPPEKRTSEFDLYQHEPVVVMVDHELNLLGWYHPYDERSLGAMRKELERALAAAEKAKA